MRKRTRYLLLLVGFIFFILFSPIIVLYVKGITYDFNNGKFIQTGILAIRTEPKNVNIYLDGKIKQKKEGDIKFLLPKEYQVTIQKPNYFNWTKRLPVNEGRVTWASNNNSRIYLLKQSLPATISESVLDFYIDTNNLTYLTNTNINTGKIGGSFEITTLPKPANKIKFLGDSYYLLYNTSSPETFIYNAKSHEITDISELSINYNQIAKIDDNLYFINNSKLTKYNIINKTSELLFNNTSSFTFFNNNLYYIHQNSLFVSSYPFTQSQELILDLPNFKNSQIFVTFSKQVLLLADNAIYKINSTAEKIAEDVYNSDFNTNNSYLSILHSGQFDYYNPYSQELVFVTRSSEQIQNLEVKTNIGYAFFTSEKGLYAIELDTRDKQNQYPLILGTGVSKFSIYNSDQNIIFLENQTLKTIDLR